MRCLQTLVLLAAAAAAGSAHALAATLVGSGFAQPVFLAAPAGDGRLFVVEKAGRIRVIDGGAVSTFLDIRSKVDSAGERGLLGLAFDPNYAANGRYYVNYIDAVSKNTVVERHTAPLPGLAPAAPQTILTVAQPAGLSNHKAGWIGFRPGEPGNLYVATGDGGGSNDPSGFAQNLSSNLGKILRVTPTETGYAIPAGNPFAGLPGNDEIWASGLRNPFRASFDRATGDFWIGDVGQGAREEIDFAANGTGGGANYGWRSLEGTRVTGLDGPGPFPGTTPPLYEYPHGAMGRSVIGGYVYRGGAEDELEGDYVFGDFASGRIFRLERTAGDPVVTEIFAGLFGANTLASFGEDGYGGLYALGLDGNVYRLAGAAIPEPQSLLLLLLGIAALAWRGLRRPRPDR